jgi:hypothetical protein
MKPKVIALSLLVLATPVLGANTFYVVINKAGFCSISATRPAPGSDSKFIGDELGYPNKEEALKVMKSSPNGACKNIFN